jgi:HEPN domain-containing protein
MPKQEDPKVWLSFSCSDLSMAQGEIQRKINPRHRNYEGIVYFCQQCAEKALKAYLYSMNQKPWGHVLPNLLQECTVFNAEFNSERIQRHCNFLDQFILARYPSFKMSVDSALAKRALNSAQKVLEFVQHRI